MVILLFSHHTYSIYKVRMVILLFSYHTYSIYKVRKPRMTKLGQGVEVRAVDPMIKVVDPDNLIGSGPGFFLNGRICALKKYLYMLQTSSPEPKQFAFKR